MKKRTFLSLILSVIVCLLLMNVYLTREVIRVSFDVEGMQRLEFHLFYTQNAKKKIEKGKEVFQEIDTEKQSKVIFELPIKHLSKLRLYVGAKPKNLRIWNLAVCGREWININLANLEPLNITDYKINDGVALITTDSRSGSLTVIDDLNISSRIKIDLLLLVVLSVLSYWGIYKLVYYIGWLKIIQKYSRMDIVFIVVFSIILLIPAMYIDNSEISKKENRMLTVFPHMFDKVGGINLNFGKEFNSWFSDRFFMRYAVIKNFDKLKIRINPNQGNNAVLTGLDGWYFLKADNGIENFRNVQMYSEDELIVITNYLQRIKSWCDKHHKLFYFMISPDKSRVYGEYYRFAVKERSDSESKTMQLIKFIRDHSDINVIYPLGDLLNHKKDGLLYFKNDTHWSDLGAYVGYQSLLNELSNHNDIEKIRPIGYKQITRAKGDLNVMFSGAKEDHNTLYQQPIIMRNEKCNTISNMKDDVKCYNSNGKLNIAFYRDSFFEGMAPFIYNTFNRTFAMWTYDISEDDLDFLRENTDIIVLEVLERFIPKLKQCTFPE